MKSLKEILSFPNFNASLSGNFNLFLSDKESSSIENFIENVFERVCERLFEKHFNSLREELKTEIQSSIQSKNLITIATENRHTSNTSSKFTEQHSARKGRPMKETLFCAENNVVMAETELREAERLRMFLEDHALCESLLSASEEDYLNEILVGFLRRWIATNMISEDFGRAAFYRFITNKVGIRSGVMDKTYTNKINDFLNNINYRYITEKEITKYFNNNISIH